MPRLVVSLALAGVALGAAAASSAAIVTPCRGCTVQRIVLVESRATTTNTSVPVHPGRMSGGDLFLWAGGKYATPQGLLSGTIMGFGTFSSSKPHAHFRGTDFFQFDNGSTLVTKGYSTAVGPGRTLPRSYRHAIIGGTGRFFAATGEEVGYRLKGGRYRHELTVVLPPKTAKVRTIRSLAFLSVKTLVDLSGPGTEDVGDQRVIVGDLRGEDDAASIGLYYVRSYILQVLDGGAHQWLGGPIAYRFASGGTLAGAGAYQRVPGAAPGSLAPAPRVITSGTGPYAGYHGELIPEDVAPGVTFHTIRLVKGDASAPNERHHDVATSSP